eukprot:8781083-Pyramimonas_sp.AAC.2
MSTAEDRLSVGPAMSSSAHRLNRRGLGNGFPPTSVPRSSSAARDLLGSPASPAPWGVHSLSTARQRRRDLRALPPSGASQSPGSKGGSSQTRTTAAGAGRSTPAALSPPRAVSQHLAAAAAAPAPDRPAA